jgi:hypothetical protein
VLLPELRWDQLPAGSALMVIHPRVQLDPAQVRAFLASGGRLLVADDFGEADALLEDLGITRRAPSGSVAAHRFHDGNPNLPVARVTGARHALNEGLGEVVANHPAYFTSRWPTLLGFGRGVQQLLVAATVGRGRLVALSDPSVLISAMLRFEGNAALARNLLRYLLPEGADRVYLVTGYFRVQGRVQDSPPAASGGAQGLLAEFNAFLDEINAFAIIAPGLRALAVVGAGLALASLLLLMPLPRRDLDGHWVRPQGSPPSTVEDQVTLHGKRRASAGLPGSVLREEVEEALGEVLQAPSPISTIHPRWIVARVRERAGPEAARLCGRLLTALRRLPPPARTPPPPPAPRLSQAQLRRMYNQSRELLDLLGRDLLPPVVSRTVTTDRT